MVSIRDVLGLLVAFCVAVGLSFWLIFLTVELATNDLPLYRRIFDIPSISQGLPFVIFVVPAFLAVWAGSAVSPVDHRGRNAWLYTVIGVLIYVYFHYKTFIPHRETEHSATYVLFTSPNVYLLAVGGILASVLVSFRQRKATPVISSPPKPAPNTSLPSC
jgi:hypothetical protein